MRRGMYFVAGVAFQIAKSWHCYFKSAWDFLSLGLDLLGTGDGVLDLLGRQ
jgi:hypothetical protein